MQISELIKLGVLQNQYPQHLYRFRQLDDKFNGIIENSAMWFSKPALFNDPFDCKSNLDENYPKDAVIKWYLEQGYSLVQANDLFSMTTKDQLKGIVKSTLDKAIAESYVCCFAEEKDNILMWSHYTDCHQGVCLKFDITEDPEFFLTPVHVNYSEEYPKKNYIMDSNKTILSILTTKSSDWKYEKEIRIVKPFAGKNKFVFKKEALKEIIFGCKTNPAKIQEIKDLTKKCGFTHVTFSQAVTDSDEYKLNFKPI